MKREKILKSLATLGVVGSMIFSLAACSAKLETKTVDDFIQVCEDLGYEKTDELDPNKSVYMVSEWDGGTKVIAHSNEYKYNTYAANDTNGAQDSFEQYCDVYKEYSKDGKVSIVGNKNSGYIVYECNADDICLYGGEYFVNGTLFSFGTTYDSDAYRKQVDDFISALGFPTPAEVLNK